MNILLVISIITICVVPIEIIVLLVKRSKHTVCEITGNADQEYYQQIMSIQK